MKKTLLLFLFLSFLSRTVAQDNSSGYPVNPVPFTSVKVNDAFWGQRLNAVREVTIPLAFSKCEESGRYDNFVKAANPSPDYKVGGLSFDDTDVYKTIEGASFSLQTHPDKKMEAYIDSVLLLVAAAQEPNGYLNTARTMNPDKPHEWMGEKRWEKVEDLSHEFYNLGHMVEAAIAHYQATGRRNFLDIAIKYADCVEREIGDAPGKQLKVPGHQIAEMALAKLYTVTKDRKYLDLAKFFLDYRGKTSWKREYSQSHKPVLEQDEAVGHAVRAAYMYSGMADVAALTGDKGYVDAIDRIWDNVVEKKLYITGGIGATHHGEAFGKNYELPNKTAYCETCAAIGNVYWNHRMFLLHGESRYYDILERTLYNGLIAGVSIDGGTFFYPNPLESDGIYKFNQGACHRQSWFGCACCPGNIARFIPSVPGYIYAVKDNDVYVNLYMSNMAELKVNGRKVTLKQTGDYTWNGNMQIEVLPKGKQQFTLKLRIPGWLQGKVVPSDLYYFADDKQLDYTVKVNGVEVAKTMDKGYLCIARNWKKGDKVEIAFDMEPRIVKANDKVDANRGRIAIERGPIVYCAEWPDNDFNLHSLLLPDNITFDVVNKTDMLSGINLLRTKGQSLFYDTDGLLQTKPVEISLIPYYAWAHRGDGEMVVWLPQSVWAVLPLKAAKATLSGSQCLKTQHIH